MMIMRRRMLRKEKVKKKTENRLKNKKKTYYRKFEKISKIKDRQYRK